MYVVCYESPLYVCLSCPPEARHVLSPPPRVIFEHNEKVNLPRLIMSQLRWLDHVVNYQVKPHCQRIIGNHHGLFFTLPFSALWRSPTDHWLLSSFGDATLQSSQTWGIAPLNTSIYHILRYSSTLIFFCPFQIRIIRSSFLGHLIVGRTISLFRIAYECHLIMFCYGLASYTPIINY